MKEKIEEVTKNWDNLLKGKDDSIEFVIIAERNDGCNYDIDKECLGVTKNGELVWVYLSGCSCSGGGSTEKIDDVTSKTFKIFGDKSAEEFYKEFKCEPLESNYESY